jgi:PEP-CTERM motif
MNTRLVKSAALTLTLILAVASGPAWGVPAIDPFYSSVYTMSNLGAVPGLPAEYGGLTFKLDDPNTILIGGNANEASGLIYSIGVTRDVSGHINGFVGTATPLGTYGAWNDGGVVFGPGGVLFLARWPNNEIGQVKLGSTAEDKIVNLGPLGVVASPGGLMFVPAGFPGAGLLKEVSWEGGQWYTLALAPDGSGTYDITSATLETTIVGGPEGMIYVPTGSPLFTVPSMLVDEWSAGNVVVYDVDSNGDPIAASRRNFITGLAGAEGAVVDPLTGDFLFSTFAGTPADAVFVVEGFVAPPPVPAPGTLFLLGSGLAAVGFSLRWRRLLKA